MQSSMQNLFDVDEIFSANERDLGVFEGYKFRKDRFISQGQKWGLHNVRVLYFY